jgi:hypothetical protein
LVLSGFARPITGTKSPASESLVPNIPRGDWTAGFERPVSNWFTGKRRTIDQKLESLHTLDVFVIISCAEPATIWSNAPQQLRVVTHKCLSWLGIGQSPHIAPRAAGREHLKIFRGDAS